MVGVGDLFYLKFWVNRSLLERNGRFQTDISASAVTPSKQSSINTNRKSTTCFPMNLTLTSYVAHKSLKGWLKKQSVKNLNNKLRLLRNGTR